MATLDDQNQPLYFLKARTAHELHKMMVVNNRRHNKRFHYMNPVPYKGFWYTWFEIPEGDRAKEELSNGDT